MTDIGIYEKNHGDKKKKKGCPAILKAPSTHRTCSAASDLTRLI